jgi:hypothetical protein
MPTTPALSVFFTTRWGIVVFAVAQTSLRSIRSMTGTFICRSVASSSVGGGGRLASLCTFGL